MTATLAEALTDLIERPARLSEADAARIAGMVAEQLRPYFLANADAWLTREEAAELLSVSTTTIDEWAASGVLHPSKPTPRIVRYQRRALLAFMESGLSQ